MRLYIQACCITCSTITASVKPYMSLGLDIFFRVLTYAYFAALKPCNLWATTASKCLTVHRGVIHH